MAGLHDALVDSGLPHACDDDLRHAYERLPERIKIIARRWGLDDTVFGDEALAWFRNEQKRMDT